MANKFTKGKLVQSLPEFVDGIFKGQWFFLNDKPQHMYWLQNMSLRTLNLFVDSHRVWYAVEVKQEKRDAISTE
jgi:hypothetical protein